MSLQTGSPTVNMVVEGGTQPINTNFTSTTTLSTSNTSSSPPPPLPATTSTTVTATASASGSKQPPQEQQQQQQQQQQCGDTTTVNDSQFLKHKRRFCSVEGCGRIVKSQGLCQRHGAKPRTCKVEGCTKQAQGNFDKMCKSHFKAMKRRTTPIPKVETTGAPPPPEGVSVYDAILPQSIAFNATKAASGGTMPLIAHLKHGFDTLKPPAWHRNEERRARGLFPIDNPAAQLEGWERELVWMEILVLTGVPGASFRQLARAWGRDKGFHMVLAQFICERHGDVERKKRHGENNTNNNTSSAVGAAAIQQQQRPVTKKRKTSKGNKATPDNVGADVWDTSIYGDLDTNEALAAEIFDFTEKEFERGISKYKGKDNVMLRMYNEAEAACPSPSVEAQAAMAAILGHPHMGSLSMQPNLLLPLPTTDRTEQQQQQQLPSENETISSREMEATNLKQSQEFQPPNDYQLYQQQKQRELSDAPKQHHPQNVDGYQQQQQQSSQVDYSSHHSAQHHDSIVHVGYQQQQFQHLNNVVQMQQHQPQPPKESINIVVHHDVSQYPHHHATTHGNEYHHQQQQQQQQQQQNLPDDSRFHLQPYPVRLDVPHHHEGLAVQQQPPQQQLLLHQQHLQPSGQFQQSLEVQNQYDDGGHDTEGTQLLRSTSVQRDDSYQQQNQLQRTGAFAPGAQNDQNNMIQRIDRVDHDEHDEHVDALDEHTLAHAEKDP